MTGAASTPGAGIPHAASTGGRSWLAVECPVCYQCRRQAEAIPESRFMHATAMTPRIKAAIWVAAEIRRCRVNGIDAYLVRRGDEHAGAILIKHNRFDVGCVVYAPATSPDGGRAWRRGAGDDPVPEAEADAYIARQHGYDPDLWVVEIEDPRGTWALTEPMLP